MSKTKIAYEDESLASKHEIGQKTPHYRLARRTSRMPVSAVREILKVTEHPEIISFAGGLPAPEFFPVEALARAHADVFAEEGAAAMQYSMTEGHVPLRDWIAGRLRGRGIRADSSDVIITSGSQQGIDLVGKIFIEPGDSVVVENPSYLAALQVFNGYEARFIGIESDDLGMRVEQLAPILERERPKLIYVVSDFHNPKGTTLSIERRKLLIELSRRHSVPILEDDPYYELRFTGEMPAPLAAMDKDGLVIYLSTFSKTLSPGMRVAWLYAPKELMQYIVIAKQAADLHTSTIEQRAAARLLKTFDYDGHLARLREVYGLRCRAMLSAIERHFPTGVKWTRPEGGLFLWVELPKRIDAEELFEDAINERVAFVPGKSFFVTEQPLNFARLNFSNQPPDLIEEGVKRISEVLKRRLS